MSYIIHLVAMTNDGYIGLDDKLPFSIPEDLKNFKSLTQDSLICMGFKTFQSIFDNYVKDQTKFLPGRKVTVVCSDEVKAAQRTKDYPVDNVLFVSHKMFTSLVHRNHRPILVVGGAVLFDMFRPNLIVATAVDTVAVEEDDEVEVTDKGNIRKSDGKVLTAYPYFNRLKTDWCELSFATNESTSGLDYSYKVYHPAH